MRLLVAALILLSCEEKFPNSMPDPDPDPDPAPPILERPPSATLRCTPGSITNHTPSQWHRPSIATSTAGVFLARDEYAWDGTQFRNVFVDFRVTPILADGSLGAPTATAAQWQGQLVQHGDGMRLLVPSREGASLAFSGDVLAEGHVASGRARVVIGSQIVDLGEAVEVAPAAILIGLDDGFAFAWRSQDAVRFAILERDGAIRSGPTAIASPVGEHATIGAQGFASNRIGMVAIEGEILVAWVEGFDNGKFFWSETRGIGLQTVDPEGLAWTAIRVARFDSAGNEEERAWLAAPRDHVDQAEPELIRFGDRVAILWGAGAHTYLCGGCYPHHALMVALIDPETLSPASEPVSLAPMEGGLLGRVSAFEGGTLYSAQRIQYHVTSDAAITTFACR